MYESVDNKLYFKFAGATKDIGFYEYMGSKERDNCIRFNDPLKKTKQDAEKKKCEGWW